MSEDATVFFKLRQGACERFVTSCTSSDPSRVADYAYDKQGLATRMSDFAGDRSTVREQARWTVGGLKYELDALGRVVRRGDLTLHYGPTGQIEAAQKGARAWSYVIDETGQRLARTENGVVTEVAHRSPSSGLRNVNRKVSLLEARSKEQVSCSKGRGSPSVPSAAIPRT